MALHVPPVTDETDAIAAFLAQQQDAFRALLFGLTPAQAAAAPSASSLSIGGLVRHATLGPAGLARQRRGRARPPRAAATASTTTSTASASTPTARSTTCWPTSTR